jgi:hypothetical protein
MLKVHVIIPHYGNDILLEQCLDGVRKNKGEFEIVEHVINNNHPNENLFFTKAINNGLDFVGRYDVAWLLNNDCIPYENCVSAALRCLNGEYKAAIVGSKNISMSNHDFIYWGGSHDCFPAGVHKTGSVSAGHLAKRTEEKWVTFSSVFISGELINKIGKLDENMRHIFSDSDYCYRARWAGYKCFYEPESIVLHAIGTSNNGASESLKNIMRNDLMFFRRKWVEGAYLALAHPEIYKLI